MNSQSTGRNQRPKGLKVKPAFQIALVLTVCFWLLYQVKYSHGSDSEGARNKASEEHGSDILGRKGNAGWSKGGVMSGSEERNLVEESIKKEDRGVGVAVLDGNAEEKNEEEAVHEVSDHAHGNLGNHEGSEIERETETQHKELSNTDDNSDVEVKGNYAVEVNENSLQEENSQEGHEVTQASISDQGGEKDLKHISHDEVGEDTKQNSQVSHVEYENEKDRENEPQKLEESSTNNDISMQHGERKGDSLQGPDPLVDGVHGFDDENGVPLDGSDLVESIVTGSSGDRAIVAHQDLDSSSDNQTYTKESTVNEEVLSTEGSKGADFEAKGKIPVEDKKSKVEISSEIGIHADTSRVDIVSETTQGRRSVSDS